MSKRTYYDPVHKGIELDDKNPDEEMVISLIDSSPFQRLRRIKQLGPASLTFHGAETSRFSHSLGVFCIARKAFGKLLKINPSLRKLRGLLYASALLHDIGHGPLSHTSEEMFGINHEKWSSKIIREHTEISNILETVEKSLSIKVGDLIEGKNNNFKLIKSLVSSQLDCDRLDYLIRDSQCCGTHYGQIDLERILSAITIAPDGDMAINPKGILAVEHYLVARNLMYRTLYNHRLNEVNNWLLEKIINEARQIGSNKIWVDECLKEWIWKPKDILIKTYLANDDIRTIYHLHRWSEDSPDSLKNLCKCFINRKLLKAVNIEEFPIESQLETLAYARKLSENISKDPEFSCGLRHNKFFGYQPYKSGLRVWNGTDLKAIEKESLLIEKLINPAKTAWLIYPKEIESNLLEEISRVRTSINH